jgi:hypothetical protein
MSSRSAFHTLIALAFAASLPAAAEPPKSRSAPSDAEVHALRLQLDAIGEQIEQLSRAADTDPERQRMESSWRALQDYMGSMHGKWDTGPPWMMGPDELVQGPSWLSCPALGGTGAAWPLPDGLTPRQYGQQMGEHLQQWKEQLDQLAQTQDLARRQRLVQEHWHELYRDMQSMRGLGWMWGGPIKGRDALGPGLAKAPGTNGKSTLPDPGSPGAKLVTDYCTQCHVAPAPILHTKEEWANVVGRMHGNLERGTNSRIRAPDEKQLETIFTYLQQHAR